MASRAAAAGRPETPWPLPADLAQADRRGRRRARRTSDILKATAIVVHEKGYHSTGLEDIAERLDMGKASLYHYFDSKETLVYATLEACHLYVTARLTEVASGPGRARERLAALVETQVRIVLLDYPEGTRLFLHHLDWPNGIADEVRAFRHVHDEIFRKVITEAVNNGEIAVVNPGVARLCLFGALNYLPEWISGGRSVPNTIKVVVDTVMQLFPEADVPKPSRLRKGR
jgi:AcrR family transcriptional regulator